MLKKFLGNGATWLTAFALAVLALAVFGLPDALQRFAHHAPQLIVFGATIGATLPTIVDIAKRTDPNGRLATIAELLAQKNDALDDIPWIEANDTDTHTITTRVGLPTVYWRLYNQGVPNSKSLTAQSKEALGMLYARSQVDRDLAERATNPAEYRASEQGPFLEAMAQEMMQTIFYGNAGLAPEEFTGLATRYSSLSATNGSNIIDAGGTGSDNTSIWVVGWGPQSVTGIYPRGSTAGLMHDDLGLQDAFDSNNNRFRAWMDEYRWKGGIALADWRYVVRIANIDVSNLVGQSSQANIRFALTKALSRLPSLTSVRPVIYMNRTAREFFEYETLLNVQAGGGITYDTVAGKPVPTWRQIPIRTVDQILETEARVT